MLSFKKYVTVVRLENNGSAVSSTVRHSDTKIVKVWISGFSSGRYRTTENRSFLKL